MEEVARMILALVGDVMLGRGVAMEIERRPPESFWGDTLPMLRGADLVIGGLECAITTHRIPWTRTPKVFHFRAPPKAVDVLLASGIRCVPLANNHTLDFEEQGLLDT
ncbi:MAG TPA: poly-gamma-glutamate biosynthesis protein, partial [Chloroflexi bacterium]|nr:poly-gamma-glutamate biosynthesis protein [Chloroflexota bacterium]